MQEVHALVSGEEGQREVEIFSGDAVNRGFKEPAAGSGTVPPAARLSVQGTCLYITSDEPSLDGAIP